MVFTWGEKDGSGDRFTATLRNYLSQWVFTDDYSEGRFSYNKFLVEGNSQNNSRKYMLRMYLPRIIFLVQPKIVIWIGKFCAWFSKKYKGNIILSPL